MSPAQCGQTIDLGSGDGWANDPSARVAFVTLAMRGAARSDAKSMGFLGLAYYHGIAIKADHGEAAKWIRRAAEAGESDAQFNLGVLYHLGHGFAQDPSEMFAWWLKAANQGNADAQNNLGYLYDAGEVVNGDCIEAYKWTMLAADQGYVGSQERCNEIGSRMTCEERDEANRRIEHFIKALRERPARSISWWEQIMSQRDEQQRRNVAVIETNSILVCETNYMRRPIPSDVRREVWSRDSGACVKCGSKQQIEFDHIVPISKGGSNTSQNIELLCLPCNRAKSNRID